MRYLPGILPTVWLTNEGTVIEAHKAPSGNNLNYSIGRLADLNAEHNAHIEWHAMKKYDTGTFPRIVVNSGQVVVEAHKSETFDQLYFNIGVLDIDQGDIGWVEKSKRYDSGRHPSLGFGDPATLLEVHQADGAPALFYRVGEIA
eukprot:TRINITY_DN117_c0_g1_i1.p1 TRINITY_DN117_c0_g1~~TRINITY_DN117_c0_g1_i1.p1  ORF type:complete len:145 (+),score=37.79 TRINITY_DN117_c0_g1_i1:530-964(+)